MKTLTIQDVQNYANKKGKKTEIYTTYFDRLGYERSIKTTYVGVEMSQYVWYWFEIIVSKYDTVEENTERLFWSHRYSQRTGQTVRGFRTGFNAELKILNS